MYNHYIRVNEAEVITYGYSSAYDQPQEGDILIMEDGPRQFTEVWPESLINDRGQFRYKWTDGQRVERKQEELDAEWAARPPAPPSLQDQINQITVTLGDYILGGM